MTEQTHGQPVDLYKDQGSLYAQFAKESFSWKYLERPSFEQHLNELITPNTRILDVGCGHGRIIEYLLSKGAQSSNLAGLDSSQELLSIARKEFPTVQFIHADVSNADLESGSFSVITASMVLHNLNYEGFDRAMSNMFSWLTQDGVLFYIVPHPVRQVYPSIDRYFDRVEVADRTPWDTTIPYFHRTVSGYVNGTIQAGFQIELIDEPRVPEEAKAETKWYEIYTRYPSRLVVKAKRP